MSENAKVCPVCGAKRGNQINLKLILCSAIIVAAAAATVILSGNITLDSISLGHSLDEIKASVGNFGGLYEKEPDINNIEGSDRETVVVAEGMPDIDENNSAQEQAMALKTAKAKLEDYVFSYEGLISMLEDEGFSYEAAEYAADNCGSDWYEEAIVYAISYLEEYAFSYSGLKEQMEYDGFTSEQAQYGVDNCGADWYEQAVLCAAYYLDNYSFSR